jgi:iron complex transport system substrate-binding protein
MDTRKLQVVTTVLLALGLLVSGCGGAQTGTPLPTPSDAGAQPARPAGPAQGLVVAGRSSLTIIDTLYLFPQAAERLVGYVAGRQDPGVFLSHVDPAFHRKSRLAVDAGPEQIAPLNPDVVILRSFMAETLGKPLEQLGISVVYLDLETPEQYFRDITTLGQLLGDEARAAEIEDYYQTRLDAVRERLAGVGDEQRPRVLLVQYSQQGGEVALNVPSAAWLQTLEVELAGGQPVWKEAAQGGGWTVVNLEQIAAWDPDQIYVVSYGEDAAQVVERLKGDANWQALRAVTQDQLFGFAGDIYSWDQPDPRWVLGVTWLASKIHPDRFADFDITSEVRQFFVQMYGLEEATVGREILSQLKGVVE